ncbi:MAG: NGG1p interacting factor NIF3, partial [Gammaproteobacteria bacterium]|nr:NGG1p interacting factor NIF3 [Gammaproteobacteria bacterium]
RPLEDSRPFLGEQGSLETVPEYKVELVCEASLVKKVIDAMKATHPYDEVAYCVIRTESVE